jgi:hypothetical protein
MALSLDKIKRDFARHRRKSAILGVLTLVMVGLFVKAYFEIRPPAASASVVAATDSSPSAASSDDTVISPEERLRQSRELWKVLREKRGVDASIAFCFEPSYFPVDPSHRSDDSRPLPDAGRVAANTEEMQRMERERAIREEARGLVVKSTVVGNATSRPVAVVNEHILTVGDVISGFTITAIQAREVDFKKDGITLAVKMADNGPVQ